MPPPGLKKTMTTTDQYDNRIEAVCVCLNYADFLQATIPFTLPHVDRLVVVTSHADTATKEVCRKYSVECIVTDVFTEKGEQFNKGAAINVGLANLRQKGWILHLDADIVLPLTCRNMLDKSALQPDCIYGAERCDVTGWPAWRALRANWHDNPQFSGRYILSTPPEYPVAANVIHKELGYVPIGYFQLWHSQFMQAHQLRYPEAGSNAATTDVEWAGRWPRKQRLLLPTVRVFHLRSEAGDMRTNWNGRKSKPFTEDGAPLVVAPQPGYGYAA